MQKILAFLLLIGLIHGNKNLVEEKIGQIHDDTTNSVYDTKNASTETKITKESKDSVNRIENAQDSILEENAIKTFDECMAKSENDDDTNACFTNSMKFFKNHSDEATKDIAEQAKDIVDCKNSDEATSTCILNISKNDDLSKEAKEQFELISQFVEGMEKMEDAEKTMQEEAKKHEEYMKSLYTEVKTSVEIKGEMKEFVYYVPTEKGFDVEIEQNNEFIKNLSAEFEKKTEATEEEKKDFDELIKNFTAHTEKLEGWKVNVAEYKKYIEDLYVENAEKQIEYEEEMKSLYTIKKAVVEIDGEEQEIEFDVPTEKGWARMIKQNEQEIKRLENTETVSEDQQEYIKTIQAEIAQFKEWQADKAKYEEAQKAEYKKLFELIQEN